MWEYRAELLRVVDGDTVHAEVDLGFDTFERFTFRLAGIDAPELSTQEGKDAKVFIESLLYDEQGDAYPLVITTIKDKREKYGRYLAYLTANGVRVNDMMVETGHAVPYGGGAR